MSIPNDFTLHRGLQVTEYVIMACGTLWIYEYFLTLDREVYYVWGSRWSFGKVLFLLNRYSPSVNIILFQYIFVGKRNPNICPTLIAANGWTLLVGVFISETILAMRTYALWGGRRSILVFLVSFTVAIMIAGCVLLQQTLRASSLIEVPDHFKGKSVGVMCIPVTPPRQTLFVLIVYMVDQAVIAGLTLYCGLKHHHLKRSSMVRILFQDGLVYYIYVLFLTIANVVMVFVAPAYGVLLELPLRVVGSVWCSRALLNIHSAYFKPKEIPPDNSIWQEPFLGIVT